MIILLVATVTFAAIRPIDETDDFVKVQGGESVKNRLTSHEILRRLRAAGAPTAHRSSLGDSNNRAIIHYSGSDSKVGSWREHNK